MSVSGRAWKLSVDPSSVGFAADIGEVAVNTLTGIRYIKTGAADTAWAVDTATYGGGGPHTHVESEVTNLTTDLAGKAAAAHGHTEAEVTGLVTDLAAKAAAVHTHTEAEVTGLAVDLAARILTTDPRLSDARAPTAHASTHQPGGGDPMAVDAAAATGSLRTIGTGAAQAMAGNTTFPGRLRSFQILTSGTTYTRPGGITSILVEGWAGGGGGCGVAAAAASQISMAPGGGSGGYFRKWYLVAPASGTYAIGGAGTAGNNAGAAAGNGGNTTFTDGTTLCTAFGGTGGPGFTATNTTAVFGIGGVGGAISTNGDLNLAGEPGGTCMRVVNTGLANQGLSGAGGDSPFGSGGGAARVTTGAGSNAATNSGAGGGGALALSSGAANVGGTGGAGRIIVWEFA